MNSTNLPTATVRSLVLVAALAVFGLPLFFHLGNWDLENDEAIYSYAVERMLDTGDWLTPRAIPGDTPFLEKPPLKFWLVAAPLRLGLLPRDEFGLRAVDALLGALAFGYVALLGLRLGGPVAALTACLVLFGMRDIILEHGIRSNNMEAPLVAAYAGVVYHLLRWRDTMRRADALAVGGWVTVAFMTKFVAAGFLPIVAVPLLVAGWRQASDRSVRDRARDWIWSGVLVLLTCAPWFVYQYARIGPELFQVMFGHHVYERFTAALDPAHLQPWHFYLQETWRALGESRSRAIVVAGLLLLLLRAARTRDALSLTLLVWAIVPVAIISTFTSKLFHYAYPFLPPLALAGGLTVATLFAWVRVGIARAADRAEPVLPQWIRSLGATRWPVRGALLAIGAGALVVAVLTVPLGVLRVELGDVVLRSSSVARAVAIGALAFALAGRPHAGISLAALALLVGIPIIPVEQYRNTLLASRQPAQPMQVIRDCASSRIEAGRAAPGVYNASTGTVPHPYFYYLAQLGPWIDPAHADPARVEQALFSPARQSPVVLSRHDHARLALRLMAHGRSLPLGVSPHPGVVVLLPGALGECLAPTVRAGGRPVGSPTVGGA